MVSDDAVAFDQSDDEPPASSAGGAIRLLTELVGAGGYLIYYWVVFADAFGWFSHV